MPKKVTMPKKNDVYVSKETKKVIKKLGKKGRVRFTLTGGPSSLMIGREIYDTMLQFEPVIMFRHINDETIIVKKVEQVTAQGNYFIMKMSQKAIEI